jgi:NAD-dependent protein deacetylase/lipoamidase
MRRGDLPAGTVGICMSLPGTLLATLRRASRVVMLTGAGVSAESGIATFRDKLTGLWEKFDPAELASSTAFERDPALVWGWYEWRRARVLRAQPNAAHRAIAAMAGAAPNFTLVTQNVDDLHERGGSRQLLHLHGELAKPYCARCRQPYALPRGIPDVPESGSRIEPPLCPACAGRIRPGVVWFGESLPELEWLAAREAASACEVFFCVGTSAIVQPAASLAALARRCGASTIQINPNPTDLDPEVDYAIRGPAGEVLPEILAQTWG